MVCITMPALRLSPFAGNSSSTSTAGAKVGTTRVYVRRRPGAKWGIRQAEVRSAESRGQRLAEKWQQTLANIGAPRLQRGIAFSSSSPLRCQPGQAKRCVPSLAPVAISERGGDDAGLAVNQLNRAWTRPATQFRSANFIRQISSSEFRIQTIPSCYRPRSAALGF